MGGGGIGEMPVGNDGGKASQGQRHKRGHLIVFRTVAQQDASGANLADGLLDGDFVLIRGENSAGNLALTTGTVEAGAYVYTLAKGRGMTRKTGI